MPKPKKPKTRTVKLDEQDLERVAIHEAGHAVVAAAATTKTNGSWCAMPRAGLTDPPVGPVAADSH